MAMAAERSTNALKRPALQRNAMRCGGQRRPGFTLIELMVTILIISILAGLFLGALGRAQQQANVAHTQALIAKLHSQLMLRFDAFRTRRLPISPTQWDPFLIGNGIPIDATLFGPKRTAVHRLSAIRELMRMELPDRWTDVTSDPIVFVFAPGPNAAGLPVSNGSQKRAVLTRTAVSNTYLRKFKQIQPTAQYEDAECLYLILTTGMIGDNLVTDQIQPSDIGDADGDGMLEFHDAWGNPIRFLRWAPGFTSELQRPDPAGSHDPFDPIRMQQNAFALTPLIYSAGPDGSTDLVTSATNSNGDYVPVDFSGVNYSQDGSNPKLFPYDPFALAPVTVTVPTPYVTGNYMIGTPLDVTSPRALMRQDAVFQSDGELSNDDNIHNHLIGP